MFRRSLLALITVILLSACQGGGDEPAPTAARPATPSRPLPTVHGFGPEISAEDFAAHVKQLASDEFGGRAPGTPGEQMTVDYLVQQFQRLGLKPGNGESFFQDVPMMETVMDENLVASIEVAGQTQRLAFGSDMVVGTATGEAEVQVDASEMVFVGYGVNAPEAGWNDYAGLDVKGKTVVMLINDPGFHADDESLFQGRRMTYYGRWTYKFEEAARQGARAALIIHDDAGAGYPWQVVRNGWSGAQFDLPAAEDPAPRLPVKGWLSADSATALFTAAGLDLAQLRAAAGKSGFAPVALADARLSVTLKNTVSQKTSRNVIAVLPGATHPQEAIVYTAHWDHLGTHPEEAGDNIYNGAIDNATGVAGVLEIAEGFTVLPRPARSLVFLMVTLEESGLLGSAYYAANPVIPLRDTVAVINLDAMVVAGQTRDLVVIGLGNSELDDILRPIAQRQDRVLVEESSPEKGLFFRSDHFNFAKYGVPALYAKGGTDLREGGREAGLAWGTRYTDVIYHKPADNYDASWDLRGVVEDLKALFGVGAELANGEAWPNYREGNAFRAIREASRAQEPTTEATAAE